MKRAVVILATLIFGMTAFVQLANMSSEPEKILRAGGIAALATLILCAAIKVMLDRAEQREKVGFLKARVAELEETVTILKGQKQ